MPDTKIIATLSLAAVLSLGISGAIGFELPAALLGTWETDPSNCRSSSPAGGTLAEFRQDGDVGTLAMINHDTEGGDCLIGGSIAIGATLALLAHCRSEESERLENAEIYYVAVSPDAGTLTLQSQWDRDNGIAPEAFGRCR
jgi:hypothetical protein